MPSDVIMREMSDQEAEAIREDVVAAIGRDNLRRQDVATESGVNYQTLSLWLSGKYEGRNDRIAAQMRRWLAARISQASVRAMVQPTLGYVETTSAKTFTGLLLHAQAGATIGLLTGPAGIGKTSAIREYARVTPNVWVVTCYPTLSSPRAVLDVLASKLGLLDERASHRTHRAIVDKLRGTGALLVFDDAQFLSSEALEEIRVIRDEAGIGLGLCGNATVLGRLEGKARGAEFAQLFSRIGIRITRLTDHLRRRRADAEALLTAWRVEDSAVRKRLLAVARQEGALRSLSQVVTMAQLIADGEALTVEHIDQAYAQLSEQTLAAEGEA